MADIHSPVLYLFRTWDFAGQKEYYATHQYFLSKRSLYLVLWRITDGVKGIDEIFNWLVNIQVITSTDFEKKSQSIFKDPRPLLCDCLSKVLHNPSKLFLFFVFFVGEGAELTGSHSRHSLRRCQRQFSFLVFRRSPADSS